METSKAGGCLSFHLAQVSGGPVGVRSEEVVSNRSNDMHQVWAEVPELCRNPFVARARKTELPVPDPNDECLRDDLG